MADLSRVEQVCRKQDGAAGANGAPLKSTPGAALFDPHQ
jgi:hypothetical protein